MTVVSGFLNARTRSTVMEWGELLKAEHCPVNQLELPEFMKPKAALGEQKIEVAAEPTVMAAEVESVCATCGKPLTEKVVKFCRDQSARFAGKLYCYNHQAMAKRA